MDFCHIYIKEGHNADEYWHRKDDDYVPKQPSRRQPAFVPQRQQE